MRKSPYFLLIILLTGFDQLTKLLANVYLDMGTSVDINPFFSLVLAYNYGAAFSFLADQDGWQQYFLSSISAIASIVIGVWMAKTLVEHRLKLISLTFILSGAAGNMIDRMANGFVVDFIHLYYQDFHWPIFNFADIFISVGVLLLIIADWKK